jgi:predicted enzyme related to lactoylglutathione lyase
MSLFLNVNVVSVYVTDWEAAKKFYRQTLEWPVAFGDDQIGWEEYGRDNETHIAINRWDNAGAPPAKGGTTPVFTVDDAYKVTEVLRARGVKCEDVVAIPGVVTYGTFYDHEGNRFQFANSAM